MMCWLSTLAVNVGAVSGLHLPIQLEAGDDG
jgi:hypothetical protein